MVLNVYIIDHDKSRSFNIYAEKIPSLGRFADRIKSNLSPLEFAQNG